MKIVVQVRILDLDRGDGVAHREALVDSIDAPPSYGLQTASCPGHAGGSALVSALRRAIEDAEAIGRGADPERPSERAMRLSEEPQEPRPPLVKLDVVPEAVQIARGWLGEALMKNGDAKDQGIQEALDALAQGWPS